MQIRHETSSDYHQIALIHARAFGGVIAEPMIVMHHRLRKRFDPELSLVAEQDGQIIGHALFSPHTIRLLGERIEAVNLAPIAVDPTCHSKGIGSALMEEGYMRSKQKGYALSFLLGHPEYYTRFGYQPYAFGGSTLAVKNVKGIRPRMRSMTEGDIPALLELWNHEEGQVDFAIEPSDTLLGWLSPNPAIKCQVFLRDEKIVGFIRGEENGNPSLFMAADHEGARGMLAGRVGEIQLPLHPNSASAGAFPTRPIINAWQAGMALPLAPSPFEDYMKQVQSGQRVVGRPLWTVSFDF